MKKVVTITTIIAFIFALGAVQAQSKIVRKITPATVQDFKVIAYPKAEFHELKIPEIKAYTGVPVETGILEYFASRPVIGINPKYLRQREAADYNIEKEEVRMRCGLIWLMIDL